MTTQPEQQEGFPEETPAADTADAPAQSGADERVVTLEAELARLKDHMLRALADAENTRKRAIKDKEDAAKYAVSSFARDLLDFADNFQRALAAIPADLKSDERISGVITGIESMDKEMMRVLEKHGIQKVDPLHQPFNPNFHEVMFESPGSGKPAGTIIQVIDPGYVIKDRLLRPARVGIAKDEGQNGSKEPGSRVDTQA
ncbi:MAG TPA: nucleotide exchange factor GrpE [Alphaproteobacteria bacterium]